MQLLALCHACGAKSSIMKVLSVQSATADFTSPLLKASLYCFTVAATSASSDASAGTAIRAAANARIALRIFPPLFDRIVDKRGSPPDLRARYSVALS